MPNVKLPKTGSTVKYVEKTPQDNGESPILQDVDAIVVIIHERENVACKVCHDIQREHKRLEDRSSRHSFMPQENTLTLDVSFSAWGRMPAKVIRREHVEYGKEANQWHK